MSDPTIPLQRQRRRFLAFLGAASAATALGPAARALAQASRAAKPKPDAQPAAPAPPADTSRAASAPPEISEDARTLATLIERRHGTHLDAKQLEAVTRELDQRLQGGRRLREVKLGNHEEPDFIFRA